MKAFYIFSWIKRWTIFQFNTQMEISNCASITGSPRIILRTLIKSVSCSNLIYMQQWSRCSVCLLNPQADPGTNPPSMQRHRVRPSFKEHIRECDLKIFVWLPGYYAWLQGERVGRRQGTYSSNVGQREAAAAGS